MSLTAAQQAKLDAMQAEYAALPNPLDMSGALTPREHNAIEDRRRLLPYQIRLVRQYREVLERVSPLIAELETWAAHLNRWRDELAEQLANVPKRTRTNGNEIAGLVYALTISLKEIDVGLRQSRAGGLDEVLPRRMRVDDLMERDGVTVWLGSLQDVESRLQTLRKQRDESQDYLNAILGKPEPATTEVVATS